jgi:hypothetical protein
MNVFSLYAINLLMTLAAAILLTRILRAALRSILIDLCGTPERAHFWTLFATIMLICMPVIIAMGFTPEESTTSMMFFELAGQLRGSLLGYLFALAVVGGFIALFALFAPRRPSGSA